MRLSPFHTRGQAHKQRMAMAEHHLGRATEFLQQARKCEGQDREQWLIAARRQWAGGTMALEACPCHHQGVALQPRAWANHIDALLALEERKTG